MFRKFEEIPGAGKIWDMNEEGQFLRATKNESEREQLVRRPDRYKRMRPEALEETKGDRTPSGTPDQFITWPEIRALVMAKREKKPDTTPKKKKKKRNTRQSKARDTNAKAMGKVEIGSAAKDRPPKTPQPEE